MTNESREWGRNWFCAWEMENKVLLKELEAKKQRQKEKGWHTVGQWGTASNGRGITAGRCWGGRRTHLSLYQLRFAFSPVEKDQNSEMRWDSGYWRSSIAVFVNKGDWRLMFMSETDLISWVLAVFSMFLRLSGERSWNLQLSFMFQTDSNRTPTLGIPALTEKATAPAW